MSFVGSFAICGVIASSLFYSSISSGEPPESQSVRRCRTAEQGIFDVFLINSYTFELHKMDREIAKVVIYLDADPRGSELDHRRPVETQVVGREEMIATHGDAGSLIVYEHQLEGIHPRVEVRRPQITVGETVIFIARDDNHVRLLMGRNRSVTLDCE